MQFYCSLPDRVLPQLHSQCRWHPPRHIWSWLLQLTEDGKHNICDCLLCKKKRVCLYKGTVCHPHSRSEKRCWAFFFATIGELYTQRSEDSIRWVSGSCESLQALKCMFCKGSHLSPEDHTDNTLLKLAPWINVGSFVEFYWKDSRVGLHSWRQRFRWLGCHGMKLKWIMLDEIHATWPHLNISSYTKLEG